MSYLLLAGSYGPGEMQCTILQPSQLYARLTGETRLECEIQQPSRLYAQLSVGALTDQQPHGFVVVGGGG